MTASLPRLSFYASEAPKAQAALAALRERYGEAGEEADATIALGGDGTMIRALHERLAGRLRPVFGMNCGKVGFLLNPYREEGLPERVARARALEVHPLRARAELTEGGTTELRAFNEVTLLRRIHFATHIRIFVDGTMRLEELTCDGVLVATPMGSSGYNHSAYGPILPLESGLSALTAIAPYRPRRWRGAVLPARAQLRFEILEPERRPAAATADFHDLGFVRALEVEQDRETALQILFDPEEQLSERILREQFSF